MTIKRVSSVTVFHDAVGLRMSITYSEIDESGKIISDNNRLDRLIVDQKATQNAENLITFAQEQINKGE